MFLYVRIRVVGFALIFIGLNSHYVQPSSQSVIIVNAQNDIYSVSLMFINMDDLFYAYIVLLYIYHERLYDRYGWIVKDIKIRNISPERERERERIVKS